jgi:hypothetical protein
MANPVSVEVLAAPGRRLRLPAVALRPAALLPALLLLTTAVTALVYLPFIDDFFATDDFHWLRAAQNPDAADFIGRAFGFPEDTAFEFATPGWRPLIDVYFYGAYRAFGLDPLPYHLVNVLLHGANGALLGIVVWRVSGRPFAAAAASLLFVVSPSYDLVVSSISHATEMWSSFLYLAALALYAAWVTDRRRWPLLMASALAFALALGSREATVHLPAILALMALVLWRPRLRRDWTRFAASLAPYAVIVVVYGSFIYFAEYRDAESDGFYAFGTHALDRMWEYLWWLLLPLPESWGGWVSEAQVALAIAFVGSAAVMVVLRAWTALWLWAWLLIALLPFAFIQQPMEWRYAYLATAPLAGLLGLGLDGARRGLAARAGPATTALALAPAVVALAAFLGLLARDRQWWITGQADEYERLVTAVRSRCAGLAPGGHVYLVRSPAFDPYGLNTTSAVNVWLDRVHVEALSASPSAPAEGSCVLEF